MKLRRLCLEGRFARPSPPASPGRLPPRRARVSSCQCQEATRLDHIQRVPFAIVLEGNRFPRVLSRYTTDAITLLSFFYSICADPKGCPLAWDAFEQVRKVILAHPDDYGRVRLVFLSLDPEHDTPSMLKNFAKAYGSGAAVVPWHFLTSYSYLFLNPVLRNMGEDISVDRNASGSEGRILNHLLKVFLIDPEGWVREIYSNQTLDPGDDP